MRLLHGNLTNAGGQAMHRLHGNLTNTAPANGQDGDFYVDSTGGLRYSRGNLA